MSLSGSIGRRLKSRQSTFSMRINLESVIHPYLLRTQAIYAFHPFGVDKLVPASLHTAGCLKSLAWLQGACLHHGMYAAYRRIRRANTHQMLPLGRAITPSVIPVCLPLIIKACSGHWGVSVRVAIEKNWQLIKFYVTWPVVIKSEMQLHRWHSNREMIYAFTSACL